MLSTVNHIAVNVPPRQFAFEIANQLAAAFLQTAVERDERGGTAKIERDLLRASGLLNLTIPADLVLRMDRYWRNLRTDTLHDPVDYRIRELGDWALNRQLPKPSFYS